SGLVRDSGTNKIRVWGLRPQRGPGAEPLAFFLGDRSGGNHCYEAGSREVRADQDFHLAETPGEVFLGDRTGGVTAAVVHPVAGDYPEVVDEHGDFVVGGAEEVVGAHEEEDAA